MGGGTMRIRVLLATVAATAAVLGGLPLGASEQEDDTERLVVTERMQVTSFNPATGEGTQAGTFSAAGAVNDSGPATAAFRVVRRKDGCGLLTGPHSYTGSAGTLTVFTRGVICPYPPLNPPRSFASGSWRVIGGSGAYDGLHGHGRVIATADFATGEITIARDGEITRDEQ
jgi:hypothetical protein